MKLFSQPIIVILLLALIIRLAIALWSFGFRENTDVLRYRDWGRIAYLHGLPETYKLEFLSFGTLPNNQPPGSLYIISGMYNFWINTAKVILKITKAAEGSIQWVNGPLLNFFLRLPSIIADLAIGTLIYLLVRKKSSEKYSIIASSLFLFNPTVLYNSSFWGQMDSINNLFLLLAIFALYKRKIEIALPLYAASLFIKLSNLPFLPIILLLSYFAAKKDIKRIALSLAYGTAIILLLTLPVSSTPWVWAPSFVMSNGIGEIQSITAFAFNFWWAIFRPTVSIGNPNSPYSFSEIRLSNVPDDSFVYFGLNLFNWAVALFLFLSLPIVFFIIRLKEKILRLDNLIVVFAIASLLIFLFLPRMHERYLYPFFPLVATYIGLKQKFTFEYIVLTISSFINIYIVWHPVKIPLLTYGVISNVSFQWATALITIVFGFIFYLKSVRTLKSS